MDCQIPRHTKEALSPLFHHLHQACHSAFNALQEDSQNWWFKTSSRSKASLMRDYLVHEIKKIIEEYKSIRCINKQGLTVFAINEQFAMRIKKLNRKLLTSNIPTQQSSDFDNQQLNLPGFDDVISLNMGYIINNIWTKIEGIYITCPAGHGTLSWSIHVDEEIATVTNVVEPIFSDKNEAGHLGMRAKEEAMKQRGIENDTDRQSRHDSSS